jgi:equilibrative nucleoside transporter 1/2/3
LACFDSFFALPLNVRIYYSFCIGYALKAFDSRSCFFPSLLLQRFYRYNEQRIKRQEQEKSVASGGIKARPPYWMIFKKCFPQCLNVFLVFFVTLSIFPAVYSGRYLCKMFSHFL